MLKLAADIGLPGTREQELRTFLGTFNISGDMVTQCVGTMSGGEKARLVLCMIVWQKPNLLLLDEPTNHLDLATREALALALNQFDGSVMLVSHDRGLLRSVCDEFWMVGRGVVEPFDGDLGDYQKYLMEGARRVNETARKAQSSTPQPVLLLKTVLTKRPHIEKQLKAIEKKVRQIEELTSSRRKDKGICEAQMLNSLGYLELEKLVRKLEALDAEITSLDDQWLLLQSQAEQLTASSLA